MGEQSDLEGHFRQILQSSRNERMRSIEQKIALAFTFCSTVEIETQFGHFDRANELFQKLRSAVDALENHINNPAHVSRDRSTQFRERLLQLRQRLSQLELRIERH